MIGELVVWLTAFLLVVVGLQSRVRPVWPEAMASWWATVTGLAWFTVGIGQLVRDLQVEPFDAAVLTRLGGGLVIAVVLGWVRGRLVRVWVQDGAVWRRGTWWSALGWVVTVAALAGLDLLLRRGGPVVLERGAGLGSLLLLLGISFTTQHLVVDRRGDEAHQRAGDPVGDPGPSTHPPLPRRLTRPKRTRRPLAERPLAALAFFFVFMVLVPPGDLFLGIEGVAPPVYRHAVTAFVITYLASMLASTVWAVVARPMRPARRPVRPWVRVAGGGVASLAIAGMYLLRALPPVPLAVGLGLGGGFLIVLFAMVAVRIAPRVVLRP